MNNYWCFSFDSVIFFNIYSGKENIGVPNSPGGNCCICGLRDPVCKKGKKRNNYKWGQCDLCDRWIHLEFCCREKELSVEDLFVCPVCKKIFKNENWDTGIHVCKISQIILVKLNECNFHWCTKVLKPTLHDKII